MAVHVPLSVEAQAEARFMMLSANNILKPQDGKPVVSPTQDMVIGCYYLTIVRQGAQGEGKIFRDFDEAVLAYSCLLYTSFMGYNLGRWVYLLDAWDDLGRDLISGNYNPLRLSRPGLSQEGEIRESLREEMAFSLTQSLAQASRAFELVAAGRNQALAHNILYDGCAQKMDEILAHPGEKRKREGRKKEDESL